MALVQEERTYFKPSVNIRLDIDNDSVIDNYIPVSSHANLLYHIIEGLLKKEKRSHLIVGPYGAGKSLLATIIAQLAHRTMEKDQCQVLVNKYMLVNQDTANAISDIAKLDLEYVPIIIEGYVSNFRHAIMREMNKVFKEQDIDIKLPGIPMEIYETVDRWRNEFPNAFNHFSEMIKRKELSLEDWLNQIQNYNQREIDWFTRIYPELTSGADFTVKYNGDFISQLEDIVYQLKQKYNRGLLIVHDEFGRMLQTVNQREISLVMQDVQMIAELADHTTKGDLNVVLITHQNMRQYGLRYSDELQLEFQRVEKRFLIHRVESDPYAFIRIASYVTKKYRENWLCNEEEDLLNIIMKYKLFVDLPIDEVKNIVKNCFPLHPISLFCIPKLTNIMAQNERTLFTLLESSEMGGVKKYVKEHPNQWYTLVEIFDYFEPAFSEFDNQSAVKQTYLMFKRLTSRLNPRSSNYQDQIAVMKLLSIWEIAQLYNHLSPTNDLILDALSWSNMGRLQSTLDELIKVRVIRHLKDVDCYRLFEGAYIDISKELEKRSKAIHVDIRTQMQCIESRLTGRYILPKRYNDKKSMTRFGWIRVIHSTELLDPNFSIEQIKQEQFSDSLLLYVIAQSPIEREKAKDRSIELSKQHLDTMFIVPKAPVFEQEAIIEYLIAVDEIAKDEQFLEQDKYLKEELEATKLDIEYDVSKNLLVFSPNQEQCDWIHDAKPQVIHSEITLSDYLSTMMDRLYPYTPIVKNEAFNRRLISTVQKKAAISVLKRVLDNNMDERLGITGYGPDYLIYATVLKNNKWSPMEGFGTLDSNLDELKKQLLKVLKKKNGYFEEIISIFTGEKFGIRKPVIPLLLVTILRDEWKHIIFYKNDMYVPSLDAELLWKMVEEPIGYTFNYKNASTRYTVLVDGISRLFRDFYSEEDVKLQEPVQLATLLQRWFRSLPRISQSTNKYSDSAMSFCKIIRLSEVNPIKAMDQIFVLTDKGKDIQSISTIKEECEGYIEKHQKAVEQLTLELLECASFDDLKIWAEGMDISQKHTSKLLKAILKADWFNWIEIIVNELLGVDLPNWSDATLDVYHVALQNELSLLRDTNTDDYLEVHYSNQVLAVPKVELSSKSEAIYSKLKATLDITGKTVNKKEKVAMIWKMLVDLMNEEDR